MKEPFFLIFELLIDIAKLLGPGGSRAIIAENLLLKQLPHPPKIYQEIIESFPNPFPRFHQLSETSTARICAESLPGQLTACDIRLAANSGHNVHTQLYPSKYQNIDNLHRVITKISAVNSALH